MQLKSVSFLGSNNTKQNAQKKEITRNVLTGLLCAPITRDFNSFLNQRIMPHYIGRPLYNLSNETISDIDLEQIKAAANEAIKTVSAAGTELINHNTQGEYYGRNILPERIDNIPILRNIVNHTRINDCRLFDSIARGENAHFNINLNRVFVNQDAAIGCTVFHEIGHANNYHNSHFWKPITYYGCKLSRFLPLAIIGHVLLTKNEKPENNQKLTKKQEVSNAIRNFAPELVLLCGLPHILEEARASRIGENLARNQGLSNDLLRRIREHNRLGLLSYILATLILYATATFAKSLKNAIDGIHSKKTSNNTAQNQEGINNNKYSFNEFAQKTSLTNT